jgi:hypothetical protein
MSGSDSRITVAPKIQNAGGKRGLGWNKIIIGILATIGGVTLGVTCIGAGIAGLLWYSGDGNPKIVSGIRSASGKYKAIEVVHAGGGGLSPFCNYAILVGLASNPDDVAKNEYKNEVFQADCASDPEAKWLSDDTLQISFSAMSGPHHLRKLDTSGSVHVNFVVRQ